MGHNPTNKISKCGSKSYKYNQQKVAQNPTNYNQKVGQNPTAIISEMWFKIKQISLIIVLGSWPLFWL